MNADKLWHTYNKFRKRKVEQHRPAIYKAIQAQVRYYVDTGNMDLPTQPLHDLLMGLYVDVGRIWATNTYYNILNDARIRKPETKRNGAIGLNQSFIDAIIEFFQIDAFNTVTQISSTTRKFVLDTVAQGVQQQLSLDEIINNLLSSGLTKVRAELISRTEVMKASNAAEQIGADKTGLKTNKVWLAVRDNRTRRDHITADNQVQPDGKPFIIGAEQFAMQSPGVNKSDDGRRIPAKEIIQCRCVVGREVLRDAKTGLPLRKIALS